MNSDYVHGFIGGGLIGLAAVILFWGNGRIMGVSGIASGLLGKKTSDTWWRLAFIIGLVLGGFFYQLKYPVVSVIRADGFMLIVAGLLVGFGTVLGNGCTSGHGICGNARLSKRSMVATLTFMATGIATVWIKKFFGG